jgi:hypothetical protein
MNWITFLFQLLLPSNSHIQNNKGKGKFVPVLFFLTEHHTMKAYWGADV